MFDVNRNQKQRARTEVRGNGKIVNNNPKEYRELFLLERLVPPPISVLYFERV